MGERVCGLQEVRARARAVRARPNVCTSVHLLIEVATAPVPAP